jgi:two-component system, OmpR family, sensor histidine kinase BaeS
MKITLHYKLFAAMLAAILALVIYMSLVMQWSFDRGFLNFVNTVEHEQLRKIAAELEGYYRHSKSWDGLLENPRQMALFIAASYPEGGQKERLLERLQQQNGEQHLLPSGPLPADVPGFFPRRVFLLDERRATVFGYAGGDTRSTTVNIMYQNRVVGHLGAHPTKILSDSHQLVFAQQQRLTLILVAVAGFLIAAGLSLPIAYRLTRPIRRLAQATRDLASGRYHTRIDVTTRDELGQLSHDFNDLAVILEKNQQARSQWVADISHELRTPLSILRGKIEALEDGVYQPTKETFASLHREIVHLSMLVDDLFQLSLSDRGAMTYRRSEVLPCWALQQAIAMLQPKVQERRLELQLVTDVDDDAGLFADNERLQQLFTNLLTNSIHYTDSGGRINISVRQQNSTVVYDIQDSAPGVSAEHLPRLFERLYRVDPSRSRDGGGAGLGLSICSNIVKGHNGSIEARNSDLGGLWIRVTLPLSE